jgi:metal-responsive CopG/Arc/MetJ family transcriptional regulator
VTTALQSQNSVPVGISLPKDLIDKIDAKRQDVSRSRYVFRIIEEKFAESKAKAKAKETDDKE